MKSEKLKNGKIEIFQWNISLSNTLKNWNIGKIEKLVFNFSIFQFFQYFTWKIGKIDYQFFQFFNVSNFSSEKLKNWKWIFQFFQFFNISNFSNFSFFMKNINNFEISPTLRITFKNAKNHCLSRKICTYLIIIRGQKIIVRIRTRISNRTPGSIWFCTIERGAFY